MGCTEHFFAKKKDWSTIKDNVFDYYLRPYISKILTTHRPLVIIDCFAGKGKFDDGSGGSPVIIAEHIRSALERGNKELRGIFIEKKYVADLRMNLKGYRNCEVWEGTFEQNIDKILQLPSKGNIFLYVDPYGIKSLDFSRFTEINDKRFSSLEMLLNFNSFGFLREGCRLLSYEDILPEDVDEDYELDEVNTITNMNRIAHGDYWQSIVKRYRGIDRGMIMAEEFLVEEYVKHLKKLFAHIVNIPIKQRVWNIPKYRLIFGTNNIDGLVLMADNMHKKWAMIINGPETMQPSLFADLSGEDWKLKESILGFLPKDGTPIRLERLLINLIEKQGILFSPPAYNKKLKEMKDKEVLIEWNPARTPIGRKPTALDYKRYKIEVRLNVSQ